MERHSNKCFRTDVSASTAAAVDDDDDDDDTDCGDEDSSVKVFDNADDAQPEKTNNLQSDDVVANAPSVLTPEISLLPADRKLSLISTEVLRESESSTENGVSPAADIRATINDVMMTSTLTLPVISSTLDVCSAERRSSDSQCSVATVANTNCDVKVTCDVTVTSSKQHPVASLTATKAYSGTPTFIPLSTSTVSAVGRLLSPLTPTRVGRVLHSAAGVFPYPAQMTVGQQQAPFLVGGSALTLRSSVMPLGAPPWLPVPHAVSNPQLRLISPTAIFPDYSQIRHVTERHGLESPQIGAYYGDCQGPLDFRVCLAPQRNSAAAPDSSQTIVAPRSASVDPPQSARTSESPQQVPVYYKSTASPNEVIEKLDPVSRAVYDNFLGKLSTTTRPRTGNGRRRSHVNDVSRRYRN